MTIYQKEMQRREYQHGCATYPCEITDNLQICYNGRQIGEVGPKGEMLYPRPRDDETRDLIDLLCADAKLVREYVDIYESAPPLNCAAVPKYRKFSESGSTLFAGMYSEAHGFMFCRWLQADGGKYLAHGHYTPDYESAKEDYATRAELISDDRLFSMEQSADLHRCIRYARDYCDAVTYEKDRELMALLDKLMDAYPQLGESIPTFDEGEAPQMNM